MTRLEMTMAAALLTFAWGCSDEASGSTTAGGGGQGASTTSAGGMGGTGGSATTTSSTGGSGGMGAAGGAGGGCVGEFDPMEPNETENQATELVGAPIEDCDDMGGNHLGIIVGADDVDWYVYAGTDELGCSVDPTRQLAADGPGLRMCKYFDCPGVSFSCPQGTTDDSSPDGLAGCCRDDGMAFTVDDLNCNGVSDDADVYIRIDQPGGDASTCNGYNMAFHY